MLSEAMAPLLQSFLISFARTIGDGICSGLRFLIFISISAYVTISTSTCAFLSLRSYANSCNTSQQRFEFHPSLPPLPTLPALPVLPFSDESESFELIHRLLYQFFSFSSHSFLFYASLSLLFMHAFIFTCFFVYLE